MNLRRFDIVQVTDTNHHEYGKELYVITKEQNVLGCIVNKHYTAYVKAEQIKFVRRPKRSELPEHVLSF